MATRNGSRRYGMAAIIFGAFGATIYALMVNVTLAHIEVISGQIPFDMRPLGYDPQDAAQLLDSLGDAGRAYYLSHQIPLDTAYPSSACVDVDLVTSLARIVPSYGKTPPCGHCVFNRRRSL